MLEQIDIEEIKKIAIEAGSAIMEIYKQDFSVEYKEDESPLTQADLKANKIICSALEKLNSKFKIKNSAFNPIPMMSEENKQTPYEERKDWDYYWCIDPIDGTKEFINRNGEFTVNIALIENGKPVFGVVYVPVKDILYVGSRDGAFKQMGLGELEPIKVNNSTGKRIAVRSKSHASIEEEDILKKYDVTDSISVGSSLKFCMVAEGKADVYYRHGPTMEWDTGAGQAVVVAAGGQVYQGTGNNPFTYNKENLLNGSFLCLGF